MSRSVVSRIEERVVRRDGSRSSDRGGERREKSRDWGGASQDGCHSAIRLKGGPSHLPELPFFAVLSFALADRTTEERRSRCAPTHSLADYLHLVLLRPETSAASERRACSADGSVNEGGWKQCARRRRCARGETHSSSSS